MIEFQCENCAELACVYNLLLSHPLFVLLVCRKFYKRFTLGGKVLFNEVIVLFLFWSFMPMLFAASDHHLFAQLKLLLPFGLHNQVMQAFIVYKVNRALSLDEESCCAILGIVLKDVCGYYA